MLPGLSILGHSRFKASVGRIDDEESDIRLRGSSNHVFDKIPVSGSIDDSEIVVGTLKLPMREINRNSAVSFGFEPVQDPGILAGPLSDLLGFLLVRINGSLIDTATFVD